MATSQPKRLEDIMNNHLKVYKSTNMKSNKKAPITVNLSNNPDLTRNSKITSMSSCARFETTRIRSHF